MLSPFTNPKELCLLQRMEGVELQLFRKCLQSFPKLPLWIIEHAWAHNMMDVQEGWFISTISDQMLNLLLTL